MGIPRYPRQREATLAAASCELSKGVLSRRNEAHVLECHEPAQKQPRRFAIFSAKEVGTRSVAAHSGLREGRRLRLREELHAVFVGFTEGAGNAHDG